MVELTHLFPHFRQWLPEPIWLAVSETIFPIEPIFDLRSQDRLERTASPDRMNVGRTAPPVFTGRTVPAGKSRIRQGLQKRFDLRLGQTSDADIHRCRIRLSRDCDVGVVNIPSFDSVIDTLGNPMGKDQSLKS